MRTFSVVSARSLSIEEAVYAERNRRALATTETEDRLMASAAIIGESSSPVHGQNMPAAIGTPKAL